MTKDKSKLIVILGPTSSGKTKLAVELARRFDGEIVSADSRQVYRGMDVGTGKDLDEYKVKSIGLKGEVNIPYHLIDVAEPMEEYSLAQYKRDAEAAIDDIIRRGMVPFLVGGSGLYLQAVVDNYALSEVGADKELRTELERLDAEELFARLAKLNPAFADKVNSSDRKNKRRLVRYVELQSSAKCKVQSAKPLEKYQSLVLGLDPGKEVIEEKIRKRLIGRLENEDMAAEVDGLHNRGVTWQRLHDFGLEYRYLAEYLEEKIDYDAMVERLNISIRQFSKRQMTWFKRWERQGRKIAWFDGPGEAEQAAAMVESFLA